MDDGGHDTPYNVTRTATGGRLLTKKTLLPTPNPMTTDILPRYDRHETYRWNYDHAPAPVEVEVPAVAGDWTFCGLAVDSPLGMPAGPLLNGAWLLYYASLGFDVLTYKTVRSRGRECYDLPNLQPVECSDLIGGETNLRAIVDMPVDRPASWAVSFGMPSAEPGAWRDDVTRTKDKLPAGKLLSVSVVGTVEPDWTFDKLAADYAECARWAVESGADCIETNLSCPNVSSCDGQIYQNPAQARMVAQHVRDAIGTRPLLIKVGHVPTDEEKVALVDAVADYVDGMAMTNSIATTVVGSDGRLLFDGARRGICGAATRTASLQQTRGFARIVAERGAKIELIGVGGASTAEHVRDYLDAGASAVHVATAAMVDPAVGLKIRERFTR
jgi:dihydroorotate dehydrogenase (NAD+) catalytic subunit